MFLNDRLLAGPPEMMEACMSIVVTDRTRGPEPWFVLTGDTLFAGGVGRPDLLGHGAEAALAEQLYDSLYGKLLKLPDHIEIFPAHFGGAACGGVATGPRVVKGSPGRAVWGATPSRWPSGSAGGRTPPPRATGVRVRFHRQSTSPSQSIRTQPLGIDSPRESQGLRGSRAPRRIRQDGTDRSSPVRIGRARLVPCIGDSATSLARSRRPQRS